MAARKQKSVLVYVALLLMASGGVRVAMGIGPAIAFAQELEPQMQNDASTSKADPTDIEPLIAAIRAREDRVLARETALENRLHALGAAEEQVSRRLAELQAAEQSLSDAIAVSETANDTDIARLTAVYENMKPGDAAALFEQMAPDFASGFLVRMRPESAAAIFSTLEPQTAYSISAIIAGRNANVPTE